MAGVLFALSFAIKPQLVLVLPLLMWQARPVVTAAITTSAALLLASVGYAGIANHVDYATRVLPTLAGGYAYYANQSWSGLVQRLGFAGSIGFFELNPSTLASRASAWALDCAWYAAGLAIAFRWRRRAVPDAFVLGFAWLVATMVSPVAWQHHYAPALFVFALVARGISRDPSLSRPRVTVPLATAFALMASYFEVRAVRGALPRLAVSYVFAGAVVLAITLALIAERYGPRLTDGREPLMPT